MESGATRDRPRSSRPSATELPFDAVLMLGDNNYGDGSPESYRVRFEEPYKPLLDAGVRFYAARGNHDAGAQWNYPLFNMGGRTLLHVSTHSQACCRRSPAIACSSSPSTR